MQVKGQLFGSVGRRHLQHQQMCPILLDKLIKKALLTLIVRIARTV